MLSAGNSDKVLFIGKDSAIFSCSIDGSSTHAFWETLSLLPAGFLVQACIELSV